MPVTAIDAPVGGLNAYDSVDSMPPTDAVVLDNWIPRSGFCQSRPGCIKQTDDLGGPVETVAAYKGTASRVLIAGANGSLLDITGGGAGVSLGSGYANNRWQTAMINDRMILVNGADPELAFDGVALTPLDYTGSAPPITPGEFVGVTTFKGRAYYWKKTGTSFWYAQAGSYQGELNEFDLGPILQLGGNIVSMFTWTVDSGTGPDDMMCIITDLGELILYQGDDPGNLGYWEQVGRFEIPDPLSVRGQMKFGSDVIVMTKSGYVNLTTVLREDQISDYPAFSRKIARLVNDVGELYVSFYGHECILSDRGFLLFNVPISDTESIQYVRDSSTGSWCRFTKWNAKSFVLFEDVIYHGDVDGFVRKVIGNNDCGEPIELDALPAYHYLGDPGNQKQIQAAQVLTTHPDPTLISLTGFADFDIPQLVNTTAPPGSTSDTPWNTELWNVAMWDRAGGVTARTTKGWQNVSAFGYAVTVAVQMKIASQEVIWRQTGLRFRMAGAQ
jgi:hypothetical protein